MKGKKDIQKNNPFKVPDNYFEDINRKIISETSEYYPEIKKKSSIRPLRSYLAIAAAFTGIVLISYTAVRLLKDNWTNAGLPELTLNDISETDLNDIDLLTLEENASFINPGQDEIDVNSSDIIDFLLLDDVDLYDIYEQL